MSNIFKSMAGLLALVSLVALVSGCGQEKEYLFNGENLDGWVCVTAEPSQEGSEAGSIGSAEASEAGAGVASESGVAAEAAEPTFSVRDGALRVSGEPFGYIRTEKKYGDCTLFLEWRWGAQRIDSGIFVFLQDGDKVWPGGIQLQLRESDFGFLFSSLKLEGVDGPFCRKAPLKEQDPELADGEWNKTVITLKGGSISASVNGVLVNEAVADGTEGYIGFQSEGGPIEFRNIYIVR